MDIFSYISKYKDKSFKEEAFNEIDSMVFAQLSYLNLDLIYQDKAFFLKEIQEDLYDKLVEKTFYDGKNKKFISTITKTERYGNADIINIIKIVDPKSIEQFFAMTIRLDDGNILIIFRGTDTSIGGWEESLSLSFDDEIPGQVSAKKYLEEMTRKFSGNILVCGHSKGGNLAEFAASTVPKKCQDKIIAVYNLDGPGFMNEFFERDDYSCIDEKIHKFIPKQSIFGLMLDTNSPTTVVDSHGLLLEQHLLYNWKIEDKKLKAIKSIDSIAKHTNNSLNKWMEKFDRTERKNIVKMLVSIFDEVGIEDITKMSKNRLDSLAKLKGVYDSKPEEYESLKDALVSFTNLYKEEIFSMLAEIKIFPNK